MGSCVISYSVVAAAVAKLMLISAKPLAAAPEWMSEKAQSIGAYVIGSGYTVLGTAPRCWEANVAALLTEGPMMSLVSFAVEGDPQSCRADRKPF